MSTFVDLRAIPHATKRTTILRIDGDFMISVLENARNLHYNFTGLDVDNGQQLDGANVTDPIVYVRGIKEGTDSRLIIGVNCYYEEDNQNIPNSGLYYYSTKDHFDFEEILQIQKGESTDGKTKAPDPMFTNPVQQFPTQIYNVAPQGTTLSANTATPLAIITAASQRLYGRLGNLTDRRNYLKTLLRNFFDYPTHLLQFDPLYGLGVRGDSDSLNNIRDYFDKQRCYNLWLRMWANVISIDANFDTEQKFNLMNGELNLTPFNIISHAMTGTARTRIFNNSGNPASWSFIRFGSVASSQPWAYTPATINTGFTARLEPLITLTGAALGDNWIDYVRS